MTNRLFVSIGLATAMLGGSLGIVAMGTGAVAAGGDAAAPRLAAKAAAMLGKDKGAQAVGFAEQAVALAPRDASYRALLGRAYLQAGRFASATQAFSDVLALDPADGRAALNLALAQTATGDWVGARGTLTAHAERIAPADRGLALALAGDPAGGIALLAQAARDPAATATVRQNLALALALDGRWIEARSVASVDMAPALVDQRLVEWAAFARPGNAAQQVAALLKVTTAEDRGQPVQLALVAPADPVAVAAADPAPTAVASVDPAPVEGLQTVSPAPVQVATVEVPRPAISFAPRREIVQALPTAYAKLAAAAAPARIQTASVPAKGNYYVQLGAYENAAVARDAWAWISRHVPRLAGHAPQGMRATIRGNAYYRLSVGGLARADATGLCGTLRASGSRCFVRAHAGEQLAVWARGGNQVAAR
ncbi:hypothetical protein ASG37_11770 [Sphingomonas sp. Leaf407]|uniref:SPOR domain-containing protein n=1 Tax=unclassified Sphingomonas TaxID=196159 RepID=UPI0006FCDA8F|nr:MULTISPECIES: SPOR domain-containing protein [unclassified Sphingomonas]KQN37692.1 hypothetical protein ASE97_09060 [Sphingomonas sp. Leaf42]KQT28059.1 hypothetical protein ASG37_11770 [Sphingomonas sp. Leaf407]